MRVVFTPDGWNDYCWWQEQGPAELAKVTLLINDARRQPFTGLGKPEPLGHELRGYWSRRIDREHRLVYRVAGKRPEQMIEILQCRWHYKRSS